MSNDTSRRSWEEGTAQVSHSTYQGGALLEGGARGPAPRSPPLGNLVEGRSNGQQCPTQRESVLCLAICDRGFQLLLQ